MTAFSTPIATRLQSLLSDHARCAWDEKAQAFVRSPSIRFVARDRVSLAGGAAIVVPVDLPFDPTARPEIVDCFGRELPLWGPIRPEDFPGFEPVPDHAWLWRNADGTLMPSFNLAGAIDYILGFGDDRRTTDRDRHGRLPPEASLLVQHDLRHLPVINIWLFALLAAVKGLTQGGCPADPTVHILPPALLLSHDCDQLRGNDLYTQVGRLARVFAPLMRGRLPDLAQGRHLVENALRPRRYFFDDALQMLKAEARYGFNSALYFLTGEGGRHGARSGSKIVAEFARRVPTGCEFGIHYNYWYAGDTAALRAQKAEIERLVGQPIQSGRAHYLTLDPLRDFSSLQAAGIRNDETLGFAGTNGFRLGYAGAFQVWEAKPSNLPAVVEIPLLFMDTNMMPRSDRLDVFAMAREVEKVGGAVTILYHPGSYANPEMPQLAGVYDSCLEYFAGRRYRAFLPGQLGDLVRKREADAPA